MSDEKYVFGCVVQMSDEKYVFGCVVLLVISVLYSCVWCTVLHQYAVLE